MVQTSNKRFQGGEGAAGVTEELVDVRSPGTKLVIRETNEKVMGVNNPTEDGLHNVGGPFGTELVGV